MEQFLYKLALPPVEAHDVVKRELCVSINGAEPVIHEIVDVNLDVYELTFEQDQNVSIYLIDIDDAGNRSAKGAVCEFQVIDTVPPAAPQAPVIMDVIEIAPVVEEPVVEEPVVTEPVVEDVVAEEPVVIDEPVVEEPVAEDVVAEEPVVTEPVVEEPVAEDVVAEEPVVTEPVVEEPVAEDVVAEEPVVTEPVVEEPVAEEGDDDTVIA